MSIADPDEIRIKVTSSHAPLPVCPGLQVSLKSVRDSVWRGDAHNRAVWYEEVAQDEYKPGRHGTRTNPEQIEERDLDEDVFQS